MQLQRHPLSARYPVDKGAVARIADDMRRQGFDQEQPIAIFEEKVLDGWHRWLACQEANIAPHTVDFTGTVGEAIAFVGRQNIARRHLGRQALALAYIHQREHGVNELSDSEIATLAGCSPSTVQQVKRKASGMSEEEVDGVVSGRKPFDSIPEYRQTGTITKAQGKAVQELARVQGKTWKQAFRQVVETGIEVVSAKETLRRAETP